jgi:cytosine/adenosine deaminase-related metal-dependent hydrolase
MGSPVSLVIEGCDAAFTGSEVIRGPVSILVEGGEIRDVGAQADVDVPPGALRLDGRGCVATPGLVNTHHHMFQSLTRVHGYDDELFGWLGSLWGVWGRHDAAWQHAATLVAAGELLLSGCTTTVDHHYLPPLGDDDPLLAQAEAAASRRAK